MTATRHGVRSKDVVFTVPKPCPWDRSNVVSKYLFTFVLPMLRLGAHRPLQRTDLSPAPKRDRAPARVALIERAWEAEVERARERGRRPSLLRALAVSHTADLIKCGVLSSLEMAAILAQPNVLRLFIAWLSSDDAPPSRGVTLACVMAVLTVFQAMIHHANFYHTMRAGWNLRIGMTGVIHAKLLGVSSSALRGAAPNVASLVSSDCQRFDNALPFLHFGWISFVDLGVVWTLLGLMLGAVPATAGVGVMLLVIAVQARSSRRFARVRAKTARHTDERARASAETFSAMLTLKAYGWEGAATARVDELRRAEAEGLLEAHSMRGLNNGAPLLRLYF
jgi:ATP-binding cassette subfamily C (CFTR/MRP) protein 4